MVRCLVATGIQGTDYLGEALSWSRRATRAKPERLAAQGHLEEAATEGQTAVQMAPGKNAKLSNPAADSGEGKANSSVAHVTKERYIKVFDSAVTEAMRRMQATLEELRRGQQLASRFLPFDCKLLKPNAGEVAERLKAAICYLPITQRQEVCNLFHLIKHLT